MMGGQSAVMDCLSDNYSKLEEEEGTWQASPPHPDPLSPGVL